MARTHRRKPQNGRREPVRDELARNALVEQWLSLVPWVCYQWKGRPARAVYALGEEALQVGYVALIRAGDLYDPSRHRARFNTYAVLAIAGSLRRVANRLHDGEVRRSAAEVLG